MAIAYGSAGSGVSTETSSAALSPLCPATVNANDILIAHVFWEGTTTAPSTPSGWTLLYGPGVIQTTIARHWVYGKIAAGTEDAEAIAFGSPAVTTQRGARIYRFTGWEAGSITDLCVGFAATSHATDPQMPTVTTTVAGGLAVALVGQNDNNAQISATGESGGDWTEAVAEYTAALTPGLALQLQTCTPTGNPGTVSGGTVATTDDPVGVIGFEIRPKVTAAPTRRDSAQFGGGAGTTLTITPPLAAAAGDTLICQFVIEGVETVNLPSGGQTWTQLAQTSRSDSVLTAAWFILPDWNGTDLSYSITWDGSSEYRAAIVATYVGCDTTKAHNATSGENFKENAASTNALVDGLTTTVNDCLLISGTNNWEGANATAGSGWVEVRDNADTQLAQKSAAVASGSQSSVTHTYGISLISMTLMVALQPPQEEEGEEFKVTLEETITINDALTKGAGKVLGETVTINDALTRKADYKLVLSETVTINDAIAKGAAKVLLETVTVNDALSKGAGKVLLETVTISDEVGAELGLPGGMYVNVGGNWVLTGVRFF